jgi:hypothetical protein
MSTAVPGASSTSNHLPPTGRSVAPAEETVPKRCSPNEPGLHDDRTRLGRVEVDQLEVDGGLRDGGDQRPDSRRKAGSLAAPS